MGEFKIPDQLTFKRKEVIALLRLDGRVLDYWEKEFQAVFPVINQNGEKFYSRQDLEILLRIRQMLLVEKKSKQEIRQLLGRPVEAAAAANNGKSAVKSSSGKKARIRDLIGEILTIIDKSDKKE